MKTMGFKLMLLFLVGAVALPMIIPGPDGEPIMTIDDWIPRDLINQVMNAGDTVSDLAESASATIEGQAMGAGAQIYRWRDEHGVLHFSDSPVDGADQLTVPDDGLSMPAKRFIQNGLTPVEEKRVAKRVRSTLLNDRSSKGYSASGERNATELEMLGSGDISQLPDAMRDLPALLEQIKEAKQTVHDK